ncbi:MAG: helix-hairpin-helix domain-containing protein [Cyclobacteriaceae bacterium]|nr:helix-hairpin-helix domain-containing protein [Cyclobacteriaceae bacterium]
MKAWLQLLVLSFPCACLGQQASDPGDMLDRLADELLATAEEDVSYEELYETLTHLLANPADINKVSREQLRTVMVLSEKEINELIAYREEFGPLLDVLELQAVPGWTAETVSRVAPFVRVIGEESRVSGETLKRIGRETNAYLLARYERTLETRRAYRPESDSAQRYAGSPDKFYLRCRVARTNEFSLGFTAEKDPGEIMAWDPTQRLYGFDFYSGHLQLQRRGRLENLVIGDFQCQFGQGLQLGSAFGLGKTAQTITGIRRSNLGFLPYMSASESYYLRGVAASFRVTPSVRLHLFGSQKRQDATLRGDHFRSIQSSGLHRTASERAARGQISDRDIGVAIQFQSRRLDFGILATEKRWSKTLSAEPTAYNQEPFRGASLVNTGAYLNASWANVTLFGEFAQTLTRGNGFTAGILGNLTSQLEAAWLYRNFQRDYFSSYANVLSEGSTPQNEQGFYTGMRYTFSRRLSVSGYFDYFRFPWLRYRVYRPSEGSEWLIRVDLAPSRNTSFYFQLREETKARNVAGESTLFETAQGQKINLWIGGEFMATANVSLKSRIQGSRYSLGSTTTYGMAMVNEASWKQGRWSIAFRYALFDTDDYENRQYVYERDVWLATSLPAYEGSGFRNYLLVHYAVSRKVDLWLRWGRTTYTDRTLIGTGGDEITGNARNDVKFQLRIRP